MEDRKKDRKSLSELNDRIHQASKWYSEHYGTSPENDPRASFRKRFHKADSYVEAKQLRDISDFVNKNCLEYTSSNWALKDMDPNLKNQLYDKLIELLVIIKKLDDKRVKEDSRPSTLRSQLDDEGRFGLKRGGPKICEWES